MSCSVSAYSGSALTLPQLLKLLDPFNPTLAAAQARRESAQGALETARQYPNPTFEGGAGVGKERVDGGRTGTSGIAMLTQPLDYPFIREARRKVAEAGIVSADESNRSVWLTVRTTTRQTFYEILRRRAELE
ncbi:MAG: TolC family protein, partial [Candidatus Methylumidiphilus sp.]